MKELKMKYEKCNINREAIELLHYHQAKSIYMSTSQVMKYYLLIKAKQ